MFFCFVFFPFLCSLHLRTCFSSPGNRAAEGGDGEVGESAVLGGHADGIRRLLLPVLVQPFYRVELQEEPSGPRQCPPGRDHRGGCHRDPVRLAPPAVESINCSLAGLYKHKDSFEFFFLNVEKLPRLWICFFCFFGMHFLCTGLFLSSFGIYYFIHFLSILSV